MESFKERVYRTGDLVRILHDGCFDFLGRADDQVKLRGQRLEIGEINDTIKREIREIRDVATLVIRDEAQHKDQLVSFVVGEQSTDVRAIEVIMGAAAANFSREVQKVCRKRLPGYMVPTYVLQLSSIPLSANNKGDAKELKRLF